MKNTNALQKETQRLKAENKVLKLYYRHVRAEMKALIRNKKYFGTMLKSLRKPSPKRG